jgi:hypothetical protein
LGLQGQKGEITMKKKMTYPENFGHEITLPFFDASNQQFYDLIANLCRKLPEIKEQLRDTEEREKAEWFLSCPDPYINILLAVGFVLGQKFDLINQEAIEEMDYIWKRIKEEDWFFIYPRERKSERCLPLMERRK